MENKRILTELEMNVINKKLNSQKLTQQDSNCLSRFVRPKLKAISMIDSEYLLSRLSYNPQSITIEKKIKRASAKKHKKHKSIIIYGSVEDSMFSSRSLRKNT